jgi:hypothetical protein
VEVTKNAWGARGNEWRTNVTPQEWMFYGNASPRIHDINGDGKVEMIVGTAYGYSRLYNIDGHPYTDSLFADTTWFYEKTATDSAMPMMGSLIVPAFAELTGDTLMEAVFGLGRGGLQWASSLKSKGPSINTKAPSGLAFTVFPNPSKMSVTFQRGDNCRGDVELLVSNLKGDIVYQTHLQSNERGVGIAIESWPAGVYTARLMDEAGQQAYVKLIKLP